MAKGKRLCRIPNEITSPPQVQPMNPELTQLWREYFAEWKANFDMERNRIPAIEEGVGQIRADVSLLIAGQQRMDKLIEKHNNTLYDTVGNGLCTRTTLIERALTTISGSSAWRRNWLAVLVSSIISSVTTGVIMLKFFHAAVH